MVRPSLNIVVGISWLCPRVVLCLQGEFTSLTSSTIISLINVFSFVRLSLGCCLPQTGTPRAVVPHPLPTRTGVSLSPRHTSSTCPPPTGEVGPSLVRPVCSRTGVREEGTPRCRPRGVTGVSRSSTARSPGDTFGYDRSKGPVRPLPPSPDDVIVCVASSLA